jgi:hypothetical protein
MPQYDKEKILGYIIGVNPTGKLDYNGTYRMIGNTDIVQNTQVVSKSNLEKVNNNEIICNQIENFENYIESDNKYKNISLIIILIFLLILLIIYFR